MTKNIIIVSLLFLFLAGFGQASAGGNPFSIGLSGQYVPLVRGEAGSGEGAPGYDEVFDGGAAIAVEASYGITPRIKLIGGAGYERQSGDSHQGISFGDLDILTLYFGGKYFFKARAKGWNPYLRADIGVANFNSLKISHSGVHADYWDSSWEFMFDAGTGVEYRFDNMGIFFELKARYLDKPSAAAALEAFSKAGSSWSIPIVFGVEFYF